MTAPNVFLDASYAIARLQGRVLPFNSRVAAEWGRLMAEAQRLLDRLENSNIESYPKSLSVEGTCNWAQPGRIKRFLQFIPETKPVALELRL